MALLFPITIGFFAVMQVVMLILLWQMKRRVKVALTSKEGEDLEDMLREKFNDVKRLQFGHETLEKRITELEAIGKKSFQKSAIVRYNAFEQNGVKQSFSLALLDNTNSGFVLSALFGQEKSRLYFKPVSNGKSGQGITKEEKEAIQQATG
jgi:hypothetical protein